MKRIKATARVHSLERLRARGAGLDPAGPGTSRSDPAGPDPAFRAGLRERLVAAATAGQVDARGPGREGGAAEPVD
jgi:hypothetical protein